MYAIDYDGKGTPAPVETTASVGLKLSGALRREDT